MESVNKFYAGIGSRETPPGIEPMIEEAARFLGLFGYFAIQSDLVPF